MYTRTMCLFVFSMVFLCCSNDDKPSTSETTNQGQEFISNASFGAVYFAQTHVLQPENELFKLVSGRETLIKANVISNNATVPPVIATLTLNGITETITLSGQVTPSSDTNINSGTFKHTFDNSFTGRIPKSFIQPGLTIRIDVGDESVSFDNLNIGAPNKMIMNMFDVNYFVSSPGDYPNGWKEEYESKIPVTEIELRRVPNIIFSELTIPPRPDVSARAARVSSKEEYKDITGLNFDGEQGAALQWSGALKAAAGIRGRYALFYVNIYGVAAGGQAGGYGGVGNGTSIGIFNHELGHALSLPHWGNNNDYPYKGDMFGISAPDNYKETHVGPAWGFDLVKNKFIPPTVQENTVGNSKIGVYKKDPMQGGGTGDQEQGFIMNHFSDYSAYKMLNYLEGHIVVWNEQLNSYASWDTNTNSYTKTVLNNGVEYPVEKDVPVISAMAGVSTVTPQATIAYPPIGPYKSGLIDLYDPNISTDREKAASVFCPNNGCDVSLRVIQGGITKTAMLAMELDENADPLNKNSFKTRAINLPANDGSVTKIEVLLTPDAEINGVPSNPTVLYTWEN